MASAKPALCFVLSITVAENVFMGGAMVTDTYGLPVEFRYTEPVRATKLQRILYGEVLERYIHGDVIAANLVGRLEQKPDLFIVTDPSLVSMLDGLGRRAVTLMPARVPPLKEYGAQQEAADGEFFLQLTDSGSPLRVKMADGTDAARQAEIARLLVDAGRTMDLNEPVGRVETAIRMLWDEAPEAPPA